MVARLQMRARMRIAAPLVVTFLSLSMAAHAGSRSATSTDEREPHHTAKTVKLSAAFAKRPPRFALPATPGSLEAQRELHLRYLRDGVAHATPLVRLKAEAAVRLAERILELGNVREIAAVEPDPAIFRLGGVDTDVDYHHELTSAWSERGRRRWVTRRPYRIWLEHQKHGDVRLHLHEPARTTYLNVNASGAIELTRHEGGTTESLWYIPHEDQGYAREHHSMWETQ